MKKRYGLIIALLICLAPCFARAETTAADHVVSLLDTAKTATIASGQSLSDGVSVGGLRLFGIVMPAAWTDANITFQASFDDGSTWVDAYDADTISAGNEYKISAAASRFIGLDPNYFAAIPMIRLRSGTSSLPVAQAAARTITLVLRSY